VTKTTTVPSIVRKRIFQEADSSCAACGNSEIEALEIHHINARKDRESDIPANLILLCANCHRRATSGSLSREEVVTAKAVPYSKRQSREQNRTGHANVVHIKGSVQGSIIANNLRLGGERYPRPKGYPPNSIGADLGNKNYLDYLIRRYNEFRMADQSFGQAGRLQGYNYAILHKNIERKFKAKTFYIPVSRFSELVAHLQKRIDSTILGKTNRAGASGITKNTMTT
jgi:hypothetical protein